MLLPEFVHPRRDVFVLLSGRPRARSPEVPLVEEVHHHYANSKYEYRDGTYEHSHYPFQVQFVALMVHSSLLFFTDCNFSRISISVVIINAVIFFLLFSDFYKDAYKKKLKGSGTSNKYESPRHQVQHGHKYKTG